MSDTSYSVDMDVPPAAETVTIRELQRDTAGVFERLGEGGAIAITRRGETIGFLVPPDPAERALRKAVADGILDPAAFAQAPTGADTARATRRQLPPGGQSLSDLVADRRIEERY
jgi:antitoxin (DNA-binding transcriptional repressor) of toxin-antitoxin stability system